MEYFKKECPQCGKENPVGDPNSKGFCDRVCESNYNWGKNHWWRGTGRPKG